MKTERIKALLFCLPLLASLTTTGCNIGQSLYYGADNIASNLRTNQSKWQNNQPERYQFKLSRSCLCDDQDNEDLIVTVENQTIIKAIDAATLQEVDLSEKSDITSIDGIFQKISSELNRNAHQVEVKFNNELGYPEQLWVDVKRQTPNDEYAISVYSLVTLE